VAAGSSPASSNPEPLSSESRLPNPGAVLDPALVAFVNHLLRGAGWARDALKRFSGRTARFEVFPFALSLTVLDSGEVAAADPAAAPAVTARLTPGIMLRIAVRDDTAWQDVEIAGDTDFASAIHHVARNLRWDVEEDLSRVFGDVVAHRMAETGRTLDRWGAQALENTGRAFAEYWTEEQPLIAGRRDLDEFNRAVDALRDDVARLEKRIDNLANR
jgi:ubiquinone biosynthesis accessory factor UbiJ